MIRTGEMNTITLGDNKEYLIQDVTNIQWEGNEIQKYYNAEGFCVTTQDGVEHYVERDELSAHDERLLDRWVRRSPVYTIRLNCGFSDRLT